jgi:tetratricopeptide (TPR) repeat protein
MMSDVPRDRDGTSAVTDEVEDLYLELLRAFYEDGDRDRAQQVARRLETVLEDRRDVADSIRGEEIRSLLAELRGDLTEAIRSREGEIRKILEMYSLARDTPGWAYVLRRYDYCDVSDRLDLLAILYADQGDLDRAVATLRESKQFSESHRVPFDGQDLLDEFEKEREAGGAVPPSTVPREVIDKAILSAYANLGTPSDEILVDDETGRRFAEEVNRILGGGANVPIGEIKRRLLVLRRRGGTRGGLPRLRR